jgi:two-component system, OmpR family, response regulator
MTLKVLVVDDNQDAAFSAAELLENAQCEVRVYHDGPTAIVEARDFCPDVCVLDLTMPRMDGAELAERLLEQAGNPLRIIALTGRWDITSTHQTRNAGFEEHLVKPVDPDHFIKTVTGKKPPIKVGIPPV